MIYKLTITGNIVSSFPLPNSAPFLGGGLEWDGNYLWLAQEQTAILFKIDALTGAVIDGSEAQPWLNHRRHSAHRVRSSSPPESPTRCYCWSPHGSKPRQ